MTGRIIKGIAGFYYVEVGIDIYECKAKGIFRKDGQKPLVGDLCEITVLDEETKKGHVEKLLDRKNSLIRPAVANVDQALVVFAATDPVPGPLPHHDGVSGHSQCYRLQQGGPGRTYGGEYRILTGSKRDL